MDVSRTSQFYRCSMEVLRVFHERFKSLSRKFQENFQDVLKFWAFKGVSRLFCFWNLIIARHGIHCSERSKTSHVSLGDAFFDKFSKHSADRRKTHEENRTAIIQIMINCHIIMSERERHIYNSMVAHFLFSLILFLVRATICTSLYV